MKKFILIALLAMFAGKVSFGQNAIYTHYTDNLNSVIIPLGTQDSYGHDVYNAYMEQNGNTPPGYSIIAFESWVMSADSNGDLPDHYEYSGGQQVLDNYFAFCTPSGSSLTYLAFTWIITYQSNSNPNDIRYEEWDYDFDL